MYVCVYIYISWRGPQVFGKSLLDQPVIRYKLGAMIAATEACQSWLESITFQMVRTATG
jgi:hypothetical protein